MGGVVQHQHVYNKARWKRRSLHQRMREPLCAMCKARGIIAPAQIADHIFPHDGDERAFFEGELQSLCLDCHLKIKGPLDYAVRRERSGQPTFSAAKSGVGLPPHVASLMRATNSPHPTLARAVPA